MFGQANFKATDRLTLTVGGRWTTDRRKFHNIGQTGRGWGLHDPQDWGYDPDRFFQQYPTGASATTTLTSFDVTAQPKSFARFTPKLGIQFDWSKDVFQYFSYSQGFKSGGYDLRSVSLIGSSTPYLPQLNTTYEAGLKMRLFSGKATFNIATYYNDINDLHVRATATAAQGVVTNQLINAGKAASWGAEAELTMVPVEGLNLTGSAAWLRTKYRTFTATLPANVAGRTTLIGLDFPYAKHCAGCHGADAKGIVAAHTPDLTDDRWLFGGDDIDAFVIHASDIEKTILHGIRAGDTKGRNWPEMPSRGVGHSLEPDEIAAVTEYVLKLSGQPYDAAQIPAGKEAFEGEGGCYDCHAVQGWGDTAIGAADLTRSKTWLYGTDRAAIAASVSEGRKGVSPAFAGKLSRGEVQALSIYVLSRASNRKYI